MQKSIFVWLFSAKILLSRVIYETIKKLYDLVYLYGQSLMLIYLSLLGLILLLFTVCVLLGAKLKSITKRESDFSLSQKENLLKYNAQSSFFATIVHDLKTPIVAQLRSLSLLINGNFGSVNDEQKEILKLTEESCKYSLKLVTAILDSYKLDCQKLNLNKSSFDMISLINSCIDETNLLACEKNQNFIFSPTDANCTIFADFFQLKRVILNLLSNSITYGFKNSSISINYQQNKDFAEFFISNQSDVISKEELSFLFDKFAQSEHSHFNALGSRLGLYLSKQIITLHGGEIYAKCTDEGICTFGFILPVEKTALTN